MVRSTKYEIKRGCVLYREELEFKTILHEITWRLMMRSKGCKTKKFIRA